MRLLTGAALLLVLVLTTAAPAQVVMPADEVFPHTTKFYLSVPDIDALTDAYDQTQLGALGADPLMENFNTDFREQINTKLLQAGQRLHLTWDDVKNVYAGETAFAVVQPADKEKGEHALLAIVDATGKGQQSAALLSKIAGKLRAAGWTQATRTLFGVRTLIFTAPQQAGQKPIIDRRYYAVVNNQLIAGDNGHIMADALARLKGQPKPGDKTLKQVTAYRFSMDQCQQAFADAEYHASWFCEPFGFAEVQRARRGGRQRRGADMLKVLKNQGFTAIQGLGGYVQFNAEPLDILHRTYIYAPAVPGAKAGEKYTLAARMLDLPNGGTLKAQSFVPAETASYFTWNWKMKEAFEHSKTLVDEMSGEAVFDDVLESLEKDENGPQIDLRNELVAHLGTRASMITDVETPITPNSEHVLFALEAKDPAAVSKALEKALSRSSKKHMVGDIAVWERTKKKAAPVNPNVAPFPPFGPPGGAAPPPPGPAAGGNDVGLTEGGVLAVAHGHLLAANSLDLMKKVIEAKGVSLTANEDYQRLNAALDKLGAAEGSVRYFSRTQDSWRANWELFRQGKLPESSSMAARLANFMLTPQPEEDEEEDDAPKPPREPSFEGEKLPEFDKIRHHLAPGGAYAQTEKDGWWVVGCMLKKQ